MDKENSKVFSNKKVKFSEDMINNGIKDFLDHALTELHNEFNIIHDRLKEHNNYMFYYNERALLSLFCNACLRGKKVDELQIIQELSIYSDAKRSDALIFLKDGNGKDYQIIVEAKVSRDDGKEEYDHKKFVLRILLNRRGDTLKNWKMIIN